MTVTKVTAYFRDRKRESLLALRLGTLMMVVALLTTHVRSVRVFRWEQSVSGGLLCTYCIIMLGMALNAGADRIASKTLEAYFALFAVNALTIWRRWRTAGELTRVVVELLKSLGIRLKRQVLWKVCLSVFVSLALLADIALSMVS